MFFFFFFPNQTDGQMKSIFYIPEAGDGIYEEIATIFSKEKRFTEGFEEAKAIVGTLCAAPDYPFDLNVLTNKTKYQIVSFPLIWVFLNLQPDIEELKKYTRELELSLSGLPLAKSYLEKCKAPVEGWISRRWEAQKKWLSLPSTTSSIMLKLPEIIEKQKCLLDRVAWLEKDKAKIESELNEFCKLEERMTETEKKLDDFEKKAKSKEFRDEVGREYLTTVFKEFLKDADNMEQILRTDWFNVLQGFCSIEGFPKEVKTMIRALKNRTGGKGTTIVAEAGSTINNNDIHGNDTVNTK